MVANSHVDVVRRIIHRTSASHEPFMRWHSSLLLISSNIAIQYYPIPDPSEFPMMSLT